MATTFVRLSRGVDNGVEYWAVQPLRNGTDPHSSRGVKVIDGDVVRVRMSNGDEYDAIVVVGTATAPGTDDGHGRPIGYRSLRFSVPIGQGVELPPSALDVDLDWVNSRTVEQ